MMKKIAFLSSAIAACTMCASFSYAENMPDFSGDQGSRSENSYVAPKSEPSGARDTTMPDYFDDSSSGSERGYVVPDSEPQSYGAPRNQVAPAPSQDVAADDNGAYVEATNYAPQVSQTAAASNAYPQAVPASGSSVAQSDSAVYDESGVHDVEVFRTEKPLWSGALGFGIGLGPSFDVRDPAIGLSGRVGLDIHGRYIGGGLDVVWDMLWAQESTRRADHRDEADKVTNVGAMLVLKGYVPIKEQFILSFGAGFGLGHRFETIFSDESIEEDGAGWLARLEVGGSWFWENNLMTGLALTFNFANYASKESRFWSDCETDISVGLVVNVSYHLNEHF